MDNAKSTALSLTTKASKSFILTDQGLVVEGTPTLKEWIEAGKALRKAEHRLQWWVGDWMNFGERKYGKTYKEAAKLTGFKEETLRDYAYVASRFQLSIRIDNSFGHHQLVASAMPPPKEKIAKDNKSQKAYQRLKENPLDPPPSSPGEPELEKEPKPPKTRKGFIRRGIEWLTRAKKGDKCPKCGGDGEADGEPCKKCKAKGNIPWSVSRLRSELGKHKKDKEGYPNWLRFTDVWNFSACDESLGIAYPGRIPGQIVLNCLYYWTTKKDLVVDPMAGGGVTIDACKRYKRKCIAFDLKPSRKDILQGDATKPWPIEKPVGFVFTDPPYGSQLEDDYEGVAKLDYGEFLKAMTVIYRRSFEHLQPGGRLAILIAPTAIKSGEYIDTTFDLFSICTAELGYKLERRLSVPVSTQQIGPNVVEDCKTTKRLLAVIRDLLVFRKPNN